MHSVPKDRANMLILLLSNDGNAIGFKDVARIWHFPNEKIDYLHNTACDED
jgi:hypothetical protein